MSTSSSRIASIASGRTWVASVPAEYASKRSPPRWRSNPSAIWLRAELWVQRKRTRCSFIVHLPTLPDRSLVDRFFDTGRQLARQQRPEQSIVEGAAADAAQKRTDDVD